MPGPVSPSPWPRVAAGARMPRAMLKAAWESMGAAGPKMVGGAAEAEAGRCGHGRGGKEPGGKEHHPRGLKTNGPSSAGRAAALARTRASRPATLGARDAESVSGKTVPTSCRRQTAADELGTHRHCIATTRGRHGRWRLPLLATPADCTWHDDQPKGPMPPSRKIKPPTVPAVSYLFYPTTLPPPYPFPVQDATSPRRL